MRDKHSLERTRFRMLVNAIYDAELAAMKPKKRRNPHHRVRAREMAVRVAWPLGNRATRRAYGMRGKT